MKKLSEFSIHFNPPQAIFYPGHPIMGFVTIDLKKPMKMRGIRIKLLGKVYVRWKGSVIGEDNKKKSKTFTEKEVIVNECHCLFGGLPGSKTTVKNYVHPAGKKSYPFSITLPETLPSSFESKLGFIRYVLKAKIHKPWKFDHKIKSSVTLNELIDTNDPKFAESKSGEVSHEIMSSCCRGGFFELNANIDRTCYCVGESIFLNTEIMNKTRNNMHKLRAKLIQIVTYKAFGESKTVENEIAVLNGPPIKKKTTERWTRQPFIIPDTAPTILSCKQIKVSYKLQVQVGKGKKSALIEMNIVIGTVPYMANLRQLVENLAMRTPIAGNLTIPKIFQPNGFNLMVNQTPIHYPTLSGTFDQNQGANLSLDTPPSYTSVLNEKSVQTSLNSSALTLIPGSPLYQPSLPIQLNYQTTSLL